MAAPALPAQEVLNWGDFELCNDCELEVTELVRLGDADGPGIIEGADVRVVWDEELGYLHFLRLGTRIKIFDHDGTFLREIGGEGNPVARWGIHHPAQLPPTGSWTAYVGSVKVRDRLRGFDLLGSTLVVLVERQVGPDDADGIPDRALDWYEVGDLGLGR